MSDENPLAESLHLLWEGRPGSEKGPRPKLSLERVITTGIELADRDGLEALTMRGLAQELDVGATSLYRYVPSKRELMDLMLDAVSGPSQARLAAANDGWREFLTVTARENRLLYLAHPWALQANWNRPVMGPSSIADLDLFLSGFRGTGLSDKKKMELRASLDSFVSGSVRQELLWHTAAIESGMSEDEFWELQMPTFQRAMDSGRFPSMATMEHDAFDSSWAETFETGLQVILNGIETMVRHNSPSARDHERK